MKISLVMLLAILLLGGGAYFYFNQNNSAPAGGAVDSFMSEAEISGRLGAYLRSDGCSEALGTSLSCLLDGTDARTYQEIESFNVTAINEGNNPGEYIVAYNAQLKNQTGEILEVSSEMVFQQMGEGNWNIIVFDN